MENAIMDPMAKGDSIVKKQFAQEKDAPEAQIHNKRKIQRRQSCQHGGWDSAHLL